MGSPFSIIGSLLHTLAQEDFHDQKGLPLLILTYSPP